MYKNTCKFILAYYIKSTTLKLCMQLFQENDLSKRLHDCMSDSFSSNMIYSCYKGSNF